MKHSITPLGFLTGFLTTMTLLTCVQNASPSNATSTPAGPATNSPTTPENATSNRICIDTSEHKVSFVNKRFLDAGDTDRMGCKRHLDGEPCGKASSNTINGTRC